METEHTEGVIEKAVAYVKDMFGAPPYHRHVDSEGRPIIPETSTEIELTSKDAMRLDPHAYTTKTVAEVSAESARHEDGK
jgi:hypothetical protein